MMQPTIAHLEVDLRILNQTDQIGWWLAMHVGKHLDQSLRDGVYRFEGNLMQPELACGHQALGHLLLGNAKRNTQRLEG